MTRAEARDLDSYFDHAGYIKWTKHEVLYNFIKRMRVWLAQ